MARRVVGPLGLIHRNHGLQPPRSRDTRLASQQPVEHRARVRELILRQQHQQQHKDKDK